MLVNADLSEEWLIRYFQLEERAAQQDALAEATGIEDFRKHEPHAILVDFYWYTLAFTRDLGLDTRQQSAVFSIMKATHCYAVEQHTLEETLAFFRELLLDHAVDRPPVSEALLSLSEVKDVTDYAVRTYFAHYKLYQHAFTQRVFLNVAPVLFNIDTVSPFQIPPLSEATPVGEDGAPLGREATSPHGRHRSRAGADHSQSHGQSHAQGHPHGHAHGQQQDPQGQQSQSQKRAADRAERGREREKEREKERAKEVVAPREMGREELREMAVKAASVQIESLRAEVDVKMRAMEASIEQQVATGLAAAPSPSGERRRGGKRLPSGGASSGVSQ